MAPPIKHGNETYNRQDVDLMLQQFDFTCRTFTNVMAIKHQLQYSLFNGSYIENNVTSGKNATSDKKNMKNVTLILEYLQILESNLQDIEVGHII